MIDINKKYKTRDGRDVKIFMVDGGGSYPVLGATYSALSNSWESHVWPSDGIYCKQMITNDDLIEVKQEITRWFPLNALSGYESLKMVKEIYKDLDPEYSAIVKVTFHLGDGFEEDK